MVIKQLGHEANHSSSSSAKVKDEWSYIFIPPSCLHGKHRNVTLLVLLNLLWEIKIYSR
jgi:hypothetical protein